MMYAKDILSNVRNASGQDSKSVLSDKIKSSGIAAMIGAGVGMVIAHQRHKSLFGGAFFGAVIAGVTASIFIDKQSKNK